MSQTTHYQKSSQQVKDAKPWAVQRASLRYTPSIYTRHIVLLKGKQFCPCMSPQNICPAQVVHRLFFSVNNSSIEPLCLVTARISFLSKVISFKVAITVSYNINFGPGFIMLHGYIWILDYRMTDGYFLIYYLYIFFFETRRY